MTQRRTTKTSSAQIESDPGRDRQQTTSKPRPRSARRTGTAAAGETPARPATKAANSGRAAKTKASARMVTIEQPTAPESLPPKPVPPVASSSKQARIIVLLRRGQGATVAEMMAETGWMSHSVRGLLSGALKRKLGLVVDSRVEPDRGRVYRIGGDSSSASATAAPTAPEPDRAATRKRRAASATEARGEAR